MIETGTWVGTKARQVQNYVKSIADYLHNKHYTPFAFSLCFNEL